MENFIPSVSLSHVTLLRVLDTHLNWELESHALENSQRKPLTQITKKLIYTDCYDLTQNNQHSIELTAVSLSKGYKLVRWRHKFNSQFISSVTQRIEFL